MNRKGAIKCPAESELQPNEILWESSIEFCFLIFLNLSLLLKLLLKCVKHLKDQRLHKSKLWRRGRWNSFEDHYIALSEGAHDWLPECTIFPWTQRMALEKIQKDLEVNYKCFSTANYSIWFFAFKEKNRIYYFKCRICMLAYEGVFKCYSF